MKNEKEVPEQKGAPGAHAVGQEMQSQHAFARTARNTVSVPSLLSERGARLAEKTGGFVDWKNSKLG